MKTKEKRGKAIVGIALAAVMVASVLAAVVPMGSAATVGDKREIDLDKGPFTIIIGETLRIYDLKPNSVVTFESKDPDHAFSWEADDEGNITQDVTSAKVKDTGYRVSWYNPTGPLNDKDAWVFFDSPTLDIEIQDTEGEEIESTTRGTPLTIYVDTNLPLDDLVEVKIKDPDGHEKTEAKKEIKDLEYEVIGDYTISTDGWDTGEYEIWLKTEDDRARGLEMTSERKSVTIYKKEITIEAENDEPIVAEKVKFTVRAPPYTEFEFETSHYEDVVMEDLEDNPLAGEPRVYNPDDGTFRGKTDEDAIYEFVAKFKDDRTYTLEVSYYDSDEAKTFDDDIDIDVSEATVAFDMPDTCMIGEDLTIKGTISEGEDVDIYIEDELVFDEETVTDGEFEVDWDTSGETTGSKRIDVYIDCDYSIADRDDLPAGVDEDGTTTVRLIEPGLSAEQPRDVIAEEDDYVIKGTATGIGEVDIVIIGPDGFTGTEGDYIIEDGLVFKTSSVDKNDRFDEEIDTENAESGRYIALALSPGRDGGYGIYSKEDYGDGDLKDLVTDTYAKLKGKNREQLISMISDITIDETGSDDLMERLEFMIESPYVELDVIEDVGIGDPLVVSGTTNREDGTVIMITLTGPVEISDTAEVEDSKFNVTMITDDLLKGIYTVEADDGDGHIDTATVEILAAEEVPATPTPTEEELTPTPPEEELTPTPTPVPTEEEEPTPTPTATPEGPGFGAAVAIAGLLAVAYLVLRRRK